jgi:hypothetical protein
MDRKRLFVLFVFLLAASSVLAQDMTNIVKKIGDLNIHNSMVAYPEVWDAAIVIIVFIILGTVFLGSYLKTPGRGGIVGFMLGAIAYYGFRSMNFSLMRDLGPWFAVVAIIAAGVALIRFFGKNGKSSAAASIGVFVLMTILQNNSGIKALIQANEWVSFAWSITWLITLIYTIVSIIKIFGSGSSSSTSVGDFFKKGQPDPETRKERELEKKEEKEAEHSLVDELKLNKLNDSLTENMSKLNNLETSETKDILTKLEEIKKNILDLRVLAGRYKQIKGQLHDNSKLAEIESKYTELWGALIKKVNAVLNEVLVSLKKEAQMQQMLNIENSSTGRSQMVKEINALIKACQTILKNTKDPVEITEVNEIIREAQRISNGFIPRQTTHMNNLLRRLAAFKTHYTTTANELQKVLDWLSAKKDILNPTDSDSLIRSIDGLIGRVRATGSIEANDTAELKQLHQETIDVRNFLTKIAKRLEIIKKAMDEAAKQKIA